MFVSHFYFTFASAISLHERLISSATPLGSLELGELRLTQWLLENNMVRILEFLTKEFYPSVAQLFQMLARKLDQIFQPFICDLACWNQRESMPRTGN